MVAWLAACVPSEVCSGLLQQSLGLWITERAPVVSVSVYFLGCLVAHGLLLPAPFESFADLA